MTQDSDDCETELDREELLRRIERLESKLAYAEGTIDGHEKRIDSLEDRLRNLQYE